VLLRLARARWARRALVVLGAPVAPVQLDSGGAGDKGVHDGADEVLVGYSAEGRAEGRWAALAGRMTHAIHGGASCVP
jgi:hypothetical protein